ncbi:MAG: tRNA (adenosine(37)-N6)-dimethylallyltransferase MiaA [Candidatus Omnitrophica bacterium]|nr:tRNA (adenosine(37)-N6)-dimethylallyltransferase MiaA [Candidatus Omnitrophota bacterium]
MLPKERIIFIIGPTAVGKSEIAVSLAKKLSGEIISLDSMQIYKNMDIITSKPTHGQMKSVPHHIISVLALAKEYNVSQYRKTDLKKVMVILKKGRKTSLEKVKAILRKGKIPIFAGGTGLYMSVLIDGIFKEKAQNKIIRSKLYKISQKQGSNYLYKKLKKVDPQAAFKIHPNDIRRIIRALEVFKITGKPISALQRQRQGLKDKYEIKVFCLNMKRDKLYQRIDQRVERMFKQGLICEVKRLLKKRLSRTASCAIGIKELKGYFLGQYDLAEAKRLIQRNSRHYAKRQLTWFRKDKRIDWVNLSGNDKPIKIAKRLWKKLC